MYRILIAEDDADIVELVRLYLSDEGFEVVTAYDGLDALEKFKADPAHMAIVDVMMPRLNGYDLIKELRKVSNIPVIILSAKSQNIDKIVGLDAGADVYLTKPFDPQELIANVKAMMRRYYQLGGQEQRVVSASVVRVRDMVLDLNTMYATRDGQQPIPLTNMEARILFTLMQSPGKVFTREQIARAIRSDFSISDINVIAVHVSKLRSKLEPNTADPKYIITIRGLGYKFEQ